jgi:hypothetical protein
MPRKAVGRQPEQSGPVWDAFVRYWKHAPDDTGRRAAAWRAFYAGFQLALSPEALPDLQFRGRPALRRRATLRGRRGYFANGSRDGAGRPVGE